MLIIGLTGGIACGKSTICNFFPYTVIDLDKIAKDVLQPGTGPYHRV